MHYWRMCPSRRLKTGGAATVRTEPPMTAIKPNGDAYATRLTFDLSGDKAGELADVLALIKLEPERPIRDRLMRELAADPVTRGQVATAYAEAAKGKSDARAQAIADARAAFDAAAGDTRPLLASYERQIKAAPRDAMPLNARCWFRATHRIELDQADVPEVRAVGEPQRPVGGVVKDARVDGVTVLDAVGPDHRTGVGPVIVGRGRVERPADVGDGAARCAARNHVGEGRRAQATAREVSVLAGASRRRCARLRARDYFAPSIRETKRSNR